MATYARVWNDDFVDFDDNRHVTENRHLKPPSWAGLTEIWSESYFGIYVPVSYTFFAAEAKVAQWCSADGVRIDVPAVYHVGNCLLHTLCVLLVFAILLRLVQDAAAAALGAFLFAVHPLQIESVAWISETRGTLSGMFSLLAIWAYVRFVQREPLSHRWTFYVLASAAYLLALLSKPSAVAVPLILAVLDLVWFRRSLRQTAISLGWWLVPAAALTILTSSAQADAIERLPFSVTWLQRPLIAVDAFDFYLLKLVAPVRLSIDYGRTPPVALASWTVYFAWMLPLALVFGMSRLPHRRAWLTSLGIFAAALTPVLGLLTFSFQEISTVGDRYVYLAMLGPALALAWLVGHVLRGAFRFEIALALVALALYSMWLSGIWQNTRTLFEQALAVNPRSITAFNSLAVTYMDEQDYATAEKLLRRASDIDHSDSTMLTNRGVLYMKQKRWEDAERVLVAAYEAEPRRVKPRLYLGMILLRRNDWNTAIDLLTGVLNQEPGIAEAHFSLAAALVSTGRYAESIEHWQYLLEQSPENDDLRLSLGIALFQSRRLSESREALNDVLVNRPDDVQAAEYLRRIEAQGSSTSGEESNDHSIGP